MAVAVGLAFLPIRALPHRRPVPDASVPISYRPVALAPAGGPLRLAGAWVMEADDRRFGGLSALALDKGEFLAVSDRGAIARFPLPGSARPTVALSDLREGPGTFGKKWARDAESLTRDRGGRGWWIAFEQRHSLWHYGSDFKQVLTRIDLGSANWPSNRGAEGLVVRDGEMVVLGENGRDAIRITTTGPQPLELHSNAEIAEAARSPDGGGWVLLREIGLDGIEQSIAPLLTTHDGYRIGRRWQVPKDPFDNFEGMAIQARPGGWRFWLITDDGHRIMARTLLVALDLDWPARHDKSPARGAGPSKKPSVETP